MTGSVINFKFMELALQFLLTQFSGQDSFLSILLISKVTKKIVVQIRLFHTFWKLQALIFQNSNTKI